MRLHLLERKETSRQDSRTALLHRLVVSSVARLQQSTRGVGNPPWTPSTRLHPHTRVPQPARLPPRTPVRATTPPRRSNSLPALRKTPSPHRLMAFALDQSRKLGCMSHRRKHSRRRRPLERGVSPSLIRRQPEAPVRDGPPTPHLSIPARHRLLYPSNHLHMTPGASRPIVQTMPTREARLASRGRM